MTDKKQFKAEIEKVKLIIQSNRAQGAFAEGYLIGQESVLEHFENFVNSMKEEPKECMYSKDNYTDEDRQVLCDGCEENCKYNKKETVIEIDFEQELYKAFGHVKDFTLCLKIARCFYEMGRNHQEHVSEDLEEASKEWLRPQLDKSYANYGETKMMELTHFDGYAMLDAIEFGAQWQKAKDQSTIELAEDHAMLAGMEKMKEEMMAKAIDAKLLEGHLIRQKGVTHPLHVGDKVKVIVIKED